MRRILIVWSLLLSLMLAAGSGGMARTSAQEATPEGTPVAPPAVTPPPSVGLTLRDAEGTLVGSATMTEAADGTVTVVVTAEGLTPGDHGVHVHEVGLCDPTGDMPFSSAGGHFNPTGAMHGGPPAQAVGEGTPEPIGTPVDLGHAGDLGNLTVDDEGNVRFQITTDRFTLSPGEMSLQDADGSALVIHADPDDLTTDPSGNSGDRIACGVIFAPTQEMGTPAATPMG
jgi:Cu-Zn family superoxide dismutase